MLKTFRDHYLRIDPRSLGLFRLAFGLVLLGDLFRRWRWLSAFYSNDGVLPNHNHLFNLREVGHVWSVFHAFSSTGENHFAFVVTLLVYLTFLLGYRTRVFHVLSLVLLVSLTARNLLLENAGNYAAIALLAFTAFLPTGTRYSIDALRASLAARDEKNADDLNQPAVSPPVSSEARAPGEGIVRRAPGWSPVSLAALAVLVQIALIYLCMALQQRGGPWRDGSAMHYALHVDRWVSGLGASMRTAMPPGTLRAWSYLMYVAEIAIPVLIFAPIGRRAARGSAAVLMLLHGLTLGLLFDLGLFAWALVAAAALVIPAESWEALLVRRRADRGRAVTVIYDADCGVCLWIARVLARLDTGELITFQGNDAIEELLRRTPDGIERSPLPSSITPALVDATVVVVDARGNVHTRGRAVAEVFRALPCGRFTGTVLALPGVVHLLGLVYGLIAPRRQAISVLLGFDACGIPSREEDAPEAAAAGAEEIAPATRNTRLVTGALREVMVAVVFVAMLAQTGQANQLPRAMTLPQGRFLSAVAAWPRMLARWNVFVPAPPTEDGWMVIDAQTRGGRSVDLLTGRDPQFDLGTARGVGLGQLWTDYLDRIHQKEWFDFQKAFKDYLIKGGPAWDGQIGDNQIAGLDAYWVTDASPPPGGPRPEGTLTKEKLFTHARGGRSLGLDKIPALRPDLRRPLVPPPRQ